MIPETFLVTFLAGLFLIGLGGAMVAAAAMVFDRHRFADLDHLKLVLKCVGASVVTFGLLSWLVIIGGALYANASGSFEGQLGLALIPVTLVLGAIGLSGMGAFHIARVLNADMDPPQVNDVQRRATYLRSAGWCLIVLGFMTPILPLGLLMLAFAFGVTVVSGNNLRAKQGTLLWLLTILVERGLPLADEVEALADTFTGNFRLRAKRLADALQYGDPLSKALLDNPGLVPQYAVTAADIGEKTGSLGHALREAAERHGRSLTSPGNHHVAGLLLYWCIVVTWLFSIVGFLTYYFAPRFQLIFRDFSMSLPPLTAALFDVLDNTVDYFYLLAPLVLVPLAAMLVIGAAQFRGWDRVHLGRFGRLFLRFDTPVILRSLAGTVAARQPLEFGVERIADTHRHTTARRRLYEVFYAMKRGDDCWDAMQRQKLITKHERSLLQSAQRTGNLSWALSELAGSIERRTLYRIRQLGEAIQPILVLIVGVAVLFICAGFFLPLVHMIWALS